MSDTLITWTWELISTVQARRQQSSPESWWDDVFISVCSSFFYLLPDTYGPICSFCTSIVWVWRYSLANVWHSWHVFLWVFSFWREVAAGIMSHQGHHTTMYDDLHINRDWVTRRSVTAEARWWNMADSVEEGLLHDVDTKALLWGNEIYNSPWTFEPWHFSWLHFFFLSHWSFSFGPLLAAHSLLGEQAAEINHLNFGTVCQTELTSQRRF